MAICKRPSLKGMALVFGGQSTRGLLYLHARIPPHMVKSIGRRIAVLEFA